jgi:uncharacterized membrane protein YhaH (DUF805 family)
MLGNIIGGFVVILVGATLIGTVADEIKGAQETNGTAKNVTGAAATILDLTTIFFALAITSSGIAIAAQALRSAGMLGV